MFVHQRHVLIFILQRRVRFQIDHALADTKLVGLINNAHRRAHLDPFGQFEDVVVEHAETAVTDSHTDTELLVRAVDEIPRHRQRHLVRPQRVVRAWRHHPWQWIAFSRVLITNRLWRIPGRIAGHRGNACGTHWRPPALTSYT